MYRVIVLMMCLFISTNVMAMKRKSPSSNVPDTGDGATPPPEPQANASFPESQGHGSSDMCVDQVGGVPSSCAAGSFPSSSTTSAVGDVPLSSTAPSAVGSGPSSSCQPRAPPVVPAFGGTGLHPVRGGGYGRLLTPEQFETIQELSAGRPLEARAAARSLGHLCAIESIYNAVNLNSSTHPFVMAFRARFRAQAQDEEDMEARPDPDTRRRRHGDQDPVTRRRRRGD